MMWNYGMSFLQVSTLNLDDCDMHLATDIAKLSFKFKLVERWENLVLNILNIEDVCRFCQLKSKPNWSLRVESLEGQFKFKH